MRPHTRSRSTARPTIALVLGGGWTLGGSFHAGVVLALRDRWGIDARSVEGIVGTSSGAVTAGLIGAGMSPDDLFNREIGAPVTAQAARLMQRTNRAKKVVDRARLPSALPAEPAVSMKAAAEYRAVSPGAVVAGMLPRGTLQHRRLRHYFDDLHQGSWPDTPHLRFCAVELNSGRRVVLGETSDATPGRAIAASCSIPGWHQPVVIGETELIDGALHSVDNADAAADLGADVVIVSSPMSTDRRLDWPAPLAPVRNAIRAQTQHEQRRLERSTQVVRIQPHPADTRAMGPNLTRAKRRRRVAKQAYETAAAILDASGF